MCTAHGFAMLEVQQAPIWGNLPSILGLTVRPRRAKLFPKSYSYFKISLCLSVQGVKQVKKVSLSKEI